MAVARPVIMSAVSVTLLLASCSDSTEPSGEPGAYLTGVVLGHDGTPISIAQVSSDVWPGPDSTKPGALRSVYTDSLGRFTIHLGYFSDAVIDSIGVRLYAPECQGFDEFIEIRERALPVTAGAPDTVLHVEFELEQVAPPARVAVGQYCTSAFDPEDTFSFGRFGLWIDEISDSVRGRFRINYRMTRGDDYGHFSGAVEQDTLSLDLRHDDPWQECTGFTLEAPVLAGGVLGTASLTSEGCPTWNWYLRFFESDAVDWHWPLP